MGFGGHKHTASFLATRSSLAQDGKLGIGICKLDSHEFELLEIHSHLFQENSATISFQMREVGPSDKPGNILVALWFYSRNFE